MFKPIALTFATALTLAPAGASFAQVSAGTGTATNGNSVNGPSTAPGSAMGGPAPSNPDARQPIPGTSATNPSPVTRNRDDCNKTNCVDNPGGG